jgi:hypothetical protein
VILVGYRPDQLGRSELPTFIAHTEFRFEAESVEAAGSRVTNVAKAADAVGFEQKSGRAEPALPGADLDASGWTGYGPPES